MAIIFIRCILFQEILILNIFDEIVKFNMIIVMSMTLTAIYSNKKDLQSSKVFEKYLGKYKYFCKVFTYKYFPKNPNVFRYKYKYFDHCI